MTGENVKHAIYGCLLTIAIATLSPSTYSYNFSPTELEYLSSSDICKHALAAYSRNSEIHIPFIPKTQPNPWQELIWAVGGWHYCGGEIKIKRAQTSLSQETKNRTIDEAIEDILYSLKRIDLSHPWAVSMTVSLGKAYAVIEEFENAHKVLNDMTELHPNNPALLSSLGLISYRQHKFSDAMAYYEQADLAANGSSAEIIYAMGLTALKLGDLERAQHLADKAKGLQYPLTGLQRLINQPSR